MPRNVKNFSIELISRQTIDHPYQFKPEDFKTFVVPAINSIEQDCEPILLDHKHHRYKVTVDHTRDTSVHILSVQSVFGLTEITKNPICYQALHQVIDPKQPYYLYHTDGSMSFNAETSTKQTISIRSKVCHAHYPRRFLRQDQLALSERQYDSLLKVTNIHIPSTFIPRIQQNESLLKILRVQIEGVTSVSHIKLLLSLINRNNNEHLAQKIDAIQSWVVNRRSLIRRGVFYHVHCIQMHVDQSVFISDSDRFVFAKLLHAYFQAVAAITTVIETTYIFMPSEVRMTCLG